LNQLTTRTVPSSIWINGETPETLALQALVDGTPFPLERQEGDRFFGEATVDNSAGPVFARVTVTGRGNGVVEDAESGHRFVAKNPENFIYDADGNLLSDGRWTNAWDCENRLLSMEALPTVPDTAKKRLEFTYDSQGRRVTKKFYKWNLATSTYELSSELRFVYDGWNLLAVLDSQSAILQSFTWGQDLSGTRQGAGGVGGLLSMTVTSGTNAGTYFYAYDGNGNVTALVDALTGATVAEYEYGPFGELVRATGPLAKLNPFQFSTKYTDEETGLIYYGYRYYSSTAGSWLSRDPIGERGGKNLYEFVGNNSAGAFDILGLVLCAFDGTGNDSASDTWYLPDLKYQLRRDAPSNIEIMKQLYTGKQIYQWGVGTESHPVTGTFFGNGTGENLDSVYTKLKEYYMANPDDPIDIIGFSRGAASARIFANRVRKRMPCAKIRFLGIFDTVAQIGAPDSLNLNWDYDLSVHPESVSFIAHAVAQDEHRSLFPLTSISSDYGANWAFNLVFGPPSYRPDEITEFYGPNYWEKPFSGAHSDIGGSYQDGRNIEALQWMIKQGQSAGAPFLDLNESNYKDFKYLKQIQSPHDSRYPLLDRIPFTHLGRDRRVVFPGNL
jgi:RHS repeat-associated protein